MNTVAVMHNGDFGGAVSMAIEADGFRKDDSNITASSLCGMTPLRKCIAGNVVSDVHCSLFTVRCDAITYKKIGTSGVNFRGGQGERVAGFGTLSCERRKFPKISP